MKTTRRYLMKSSGLTLVGSTVTPWFLHRAAASTEKRKKVLVALFQRGAVDGLNMVVPYGDADYAKSRPTLALGRPGNGETPALDLDGHFGLHPAMESLLPFWEDKSLAVVHAAGSHDATRSHFDAQDFMEAGTPGVKSTSDGWLNRYLATRPVEEQSPLRAVAMGPQLPRMLHGGESAVAMQRLREFDLAGGANHVQRAFEVMYGGMGGPKAVDRALEETSGDTFAALEIVRDIRSQRYQPENGAAYPGGPLGQSLRETAQLIRADVGVEVVFVEANGWDTHTNEAPQLNNLLGQLSRSLAAFTQDLGSKMQDVAVLTMSEFGRTVRENGNRGTDHGHATAMMVLGGAVQGGRVYGEWPGLAKERLYEERDLAVTTDFRDLFAEVLRGHLGARNLNGVFPGYRPKTGKLGLYA